MGARRPRWLPRTGAGQPDPDPADRVALPRGAGLSRRPDLRCDPAGHRHQPGGGQRGLCGASPPARPGRGPVRPHRLALRHQHGEPVRLRVPGDAAGEAGGPGPGGRCGHGGAPLLAGRPDRLPRLRADRSGGRLRGWRATALAAPGGAAGHPRGHRPGLHRPGLPAAHLCRARGGIGGAGGDPGGLLRCRAAPPAGGAAGGARGGGPGLGHRACEDRSRRLANQREPGGPAPARAPA